MKRGLSIVLLCLVLALALPIINSGSSQIGELKVTTEHPFLVGGEWVGASDLIVGDELTTVDGKLARIVSVEKVVEDVSVYNIEDTAGINNYVVGSGVVVHNSNKLLPNPTKSNEIKLLPAPNNCKYPDGTKIPLRYISTQDVTLKNVRPRVQQEIIRKIESGEWVELAVTDVSPCRTLNVRPPFLEKALPKPNFLNEEPGISLIRYWGPKEYAPEVSKLVGWKAKRAFLEKILRGKGQDFTRLGLGKVVKTHEFGYYPQCLTEKELEIVMKNPDILKGIGGNLPTGHRHFHFEHYFYEEFVTDSKGNIIGILVK